MTRTAADYRDLINKVGIAERKVNKAQEQLTKVEAEHATAVSDLHSAFAPAATAAVAAAEQE